MSIRTMISLHFHKDVNISLLVTPTVKVAIKSECIPLANTSLTKRLKAPLPTFAAQQMV